MREPVVGLGILLLVFGSLFLYGRLTLFSTVLFIDLMSLLIVIIGILLILWGVLSKRQNKKSLLLISFVIVASTLISYPFLRSYVFSGKYEKVIIRNTSSIDEANALTVAENSNYSDIFNLQRFRTGNPNETWPYTWANFIDTQVIEYYDDRFENLKGKRRAINFQYDANVSTWTEIHVVYIPPPADGNIHDDAIRILSSNGSVLFENAQYSGPSWGMLFAHRNDSKYQVISAREIDFSLSKSYVVEMRLKYEEIEAPLAAFIADVYQIIIIDQDFAPFLFCVQSIHAIS